MRLNLRLHRPGTLALALAIAAVIAGGRRAIVRRAR